MRALRGEPPGAACSRPHGGVSSAAVTPEVHTEGGWQTATTRHPVEDKIVQAAVAAALTPIYEAEFLGFGYGFRPKRNQHQAPDALAFGIAFSPERSAVRKWNRLDCTGFVIM